VGRDAPAAIDGVVALIGLAGTQVGTGMVSCSAGWACKLSAHLLQGEQEGRRQAVDDEVLDSLAEITNMILGNVKNVLEEKLGLMGLSIPTVIFGRNFAARSIGEGQWVMVPFACGADHLEVRLRMAPAREPHPVRHGFAPPHCMRL
jgi:chemotaxis protein CheX